MASNTQIILETLTVGLKNLKQIQDGLIDELNAFEDQYSKDYKIVNDRIDAINVQIDKTIKDAIKAIEFPRGISEVEILKLINDNTKNIDEEKLKEDLNKLINKDIGKIKSELLQTINEIEIPQGEKGETGESATNEQIQDSVSIWIEENKELLRGDKGDKGERGLLGSQGQKGSDGVSIEDIRRDKDDLLITLTDGTEKRIALPKQQKFLGGGGISAQYASSVQIVSTSNDLNLEAQSQNVLVNATLGNINITLPNPEGCLIRGRSYQIGITKIDDTDNIVTISPYSTELIAGSVEETLFIQNEVFNFITDSNNWHLGA